MGPDDGSDIRIISSCEERECKHLHWDKLRAGKQPTCAAFPSGIPEVITDGENLHVLPFPGDHGIQYERRTV